MLIGSCRRHVGIAFEQNPNQKLNVNNLTLETSEKTLNVLASLAKHVDSLFIYYDGMVVLFSYIEVKVFLYKKLEPTVMKEEK